MESRQAIYDAVRSQITHCNTVDIVQHVAREAFGEAAQQNTEAARTIADYQTAPSVLYRPSIGRDGNKWSVLYGDNLMDGVCGFGDTPAEAMADFDRNWAAERCGQEQPQ